MSDGYYSGEPYKNVGTEEEDERITKLVKELFENVTVEFRPFAMYRKDLDQIVVQLRDCSTTEKDIHGMVTILEDNHPEDHEENLVGFIIQGARVFCQQQGLLVGEGVDVGSILDELVRFDRELFPIADLLSRMLARIPITVIKFDESEAALT